MQKEFGQFWVWLDGDRAIMFTTQEDVFIYFGMMGQFEKLADHYLLAKRTKMTIKHYRYYQAQGQRFKELLDTVKLTDGTPLYEVVKGRVVL